VLAAAPMLSELPAISPAKPEAAAALICHADSKEDDAPKPAKALLAGYGSGGFMISTTSSEAQAYFDNGMQLAHAFAHKAAISAFKRAEMLDPTCAMCVWGEAWSRGPTVNYPVDVKTQKELAALADKAAVLASDGTPKERALISALQSRYHDGGGAGRGDDAFAKAMDDVFRASPGDNEIAVLAADARMIPAAHHNDPKPLGRAMEILEAVLARAPEDTGAIHFYIHATENAGVGTKALPYALKLQALAPAASHLVHMPSHTYFWAGRYQMAEQSNLDAVEIDKANAERLKTKDGVFGLSYHGHNVQYGEAGALIDGDAKGGLSLARAELAQLKTTKPGEPYAQVGLSTAYFVFGRYGAANEVAALPDPGDTLALAQAMWRYSRGEAALRSGDLVSVRDELAHIRIAPGGLKSFGDYAPRAQAMVDVARLVLTGRMAMIEKHYGEAETAYRKAAKLQDDTLGFGGDPPAWWYPVRRSLAAALLADGNITAALAETHAVLLRWPYDPVSLRILADCESASGQSQDAQKERAYAQSNWTGDIGALAPAFL